MCFHSLSCICQNDVKYYIARPATSWKHILKLQWQHGSNQSQHFLAESKQTDSVHSLTTDVIWLYRRLSSVNESSPLRFSTHVKQFRARFKTLSSLKWLRFSMLEICKEKSNSALAWIFQQLRSIPSSHPKNLYPKLIMTKHYWKISGTNYPLVINFNVSYNAILSMSAQQQVPCVQWGLLQRKCQLTWIKPQWT